MYVDFNFGIIVNSMITQIKRNSGEQSLEDIPKSVCSIIGKTYLFELKIKEKDFQASYQTFTVSKILNHLKVCILCVILEVSLYHSI